MNQPQNFFGNLWRMAVHNPQHLLSLLQVSDLYSCPGHSETVRQAMCKNQLLFLTQQACNTQGKYLQMYDLIYVWLVLQALKLATCSLSLKIKAIKAVHSIKSYVVSENVLF